MGMWGNFGDDETGLFSWFYIYIRYLPDQT